MSHSNREVPTMSDDTTDDTTDRAAARAALEAAGSAAIDRPGDRRVHAVATAAFGLLVGAYFAVTRVEPALVPGWVSTAGYAVLALALAAWQTRAARTVPHGVRRVSRWGLVGTLAVMVVTLGVVNSLYRDGIPGLVLVVAGALVAAPMVVAAAVVQRRPR
ncbi:hypothetical protein [Terracoccus luteus]|nr:hypothetical protein [Terracoccus luteus]